MTESFSPDYTPAALVNRLFAAKHPQAAALVAPLVERLFAAQAEGHAFIYLDAAGQRQCRDAAPLAGAPGSGAPLICHRGRLFAANTFLREQALAAEIRRLSAPVPPPEDGETIRLLRQWFAAPEARDQQAAAALTLLHRFVLISGGPGTGKTTTVAALLALLCRGGLPRIALAAPTGKAAARMAEALHRALARLDGLPETVRAHLLALQGQTVHRLLGLKPPAMRPEYGPDRQLALDVLVVDETSMLDSHLLGQLLASLPEGCRVILLGDARQLPSVGAGAVLSALGGEEPLSEPVRQALRRMLPDNPLDQVWRGHARLRVSHRFHGQSGIGRLAAAVAQGEPQQAEDVFAAFAGELAVYPPGTDPAALLLDAQAPYWQAVAAGDIRAAFARQADAVLLAALREDAERCNLAYRRLLRQRYGTDTAAPWFAGQMLLMTRNDSAQNLYNGDVGLVWDEGGGRLCACFAGPDGIRRLPLSALPEHGDAFALTVHKSQGSEYGQVLFAAPPEAKQPLSRALLYTALTRARERFGYIGSLGSLKNACLNDEVRRTALAEFLAGS